ncbi:hypothetical protein HU200_023633 [Digitaria exilis]|uniref:Uncharacterized protein n=1 Tax=Digitaria exilis TaxID=1010633 RepID=A0A835EU96_9POAL|nr:hypothetical protein HU200_023633 [Digitaria exilis]
MVLTAMLSSTLVDPAGLEALERDLDVARAAIRRAARRRDGDPGHGDGNTSVTSPDTWFEAGVEYGLLKSVYRNPAAFHR